MIKVSLRSNRALIAPIALLGLSLAGVSHAAPIKFTFATDQAINQYAAGDLNNKALGSSALFQDDTGVTALTAHGFTTAGADANLFAKFNGAGADETGLGMVDDIQNQHEIDGNHFVQLDLGLLEAQQYGNLKFSIGSAQTGEQHNIYGSNTLGTLGTLLNYASGTGPTNISVSINNADLLTYRYISISGGGPNSNGQGGNQAGNVLVLNGLSLQANTLSIPEPAFYQMGVFLAGGGLMALRLRRKNRQ